MIDTKRYTYIISYEPDAEYFQETCRRIKNLTGTKAEELLKDVDGSLYQTYHFPYGDVEVCLDYYFDNEVRVDADFELEWYLGWNWFIKKITRAEVPKTN